MIELVGRLVWDSSVQVGLCLKPAMVLGRSKGNKRLMMVM